MKKFIVLFTTLLVLITVSLTGCSAVFHTTSLSNIVDKTYDFKDFTKIELSRLITTASSYPLHKMSSTASIYANPETA